MTVQFVQIQQSISPCFALAYASQEQVLLTTSRKNGIRPLEGPKASWSQASSGQVSLRSKHIHCSYLVLACVANLLQNLPVQPSQSVRSNKKAKIQSTQNTELFSKLAAVKAMVQHVSDFPLEECKTSKVLFVKAHAFYRLFDQDIKVKVLSCQFTSRSEQQYIFAGSEGNCTARSGYCQETWETLDH